MVHKRVNKILKEIYNKLKQQNGQRSNIKKTRKNINAKHQRLGNCTIRLVSQIYAELFKYLDQLVYTEISNLESFYNI